MSKEFIDKNLGKGIVTIPSNPDAIPYNASQDSKNWISTVGNIELAKGKLLIGAEETANGFVKGEGWGYKIDGTPVHFRKINTKIQYFNGTIWVDIITGLTDSAEYTFAPYQSLAGTFIFITGEDGIYKICTANPASYLSLYDSTKNYKGKSIIVTSRMYLWDRATDKTGLYGSKIDPQDSSVYTTVTAEVIAAATSGTLAFNTATRNCFGIQMTIGAETFIDDYKGNLVGSLGGTGTINYATGAWTLSVATGGTVNYQWEDSNVGGITDFTKSATRQASEGFILRQDEGGDSIQNVVLSLDNSIISLKKNSAYQLTISADDLIFTNNVFRKNLGIQYWRSAISTNKGIIFMDTANVDNPKLTILQKNITGNNIEPFVLATAFDFSDYVFDMCAMEIFGDYIIFSTRLSTSTLNDTLMLYNIRKDTIDILSYPAKTITVNAGKLYIGDVQTDNIYEILSGWDDDGSLISNYWISNDEKYGLELLKKLKRFRIQGLISKEQKLEVYISYDNNAFELVGTVLGNGGYVDSSISYPIGSHGIGLAIIGGEANIIDGDFYFAELKITSPKFRIRTVKLVATGTGYVSVNLVDDFKIQTFTQRMPSKYRIKQNVSLDGTLTDQ